MSPPLPPGFELVILCDFARFNGGAAVVALHSARQMAALGVPVTVFSSVGPVDDSLLGLPNLRVVCLGQEEIANSTHPARASLRGAWNRPAARALEALLAAKDPARTVVHAHQWTKALSPSVFPPAFARGFPVAITLHDFFIACPNGGFYEYPAGRICHRRPLSTSCLTCACDRRNYAHKLWRVGRTLLQNRLARIPAQTSHFIAVSDFSLEILRPFLPPGAPATLVRNPIECPDLGPAPVAENDLFVFAGRLVPEKGPLLFAEAARRAGVPAVFVGDGELRPELARRYPEFTITGWQSGEAVAGWLRRARALVFASQWYETLGLVVVEAAAHGVPAVIDDGCAARETVAHGERGLHFAHGSLESLSAQLSALERDPALAARLGRAAYDWYWQRPWTVAAHVDELCQVYGRMLPAPAVPNSPPLTAAA